MTDSSRTTELIIEAAVRLFRRFGYEHVTVRDICEEAGIARSSFYRIYADKKDIIRSILDSTKNSRFFDMKAAIVARNDLERMWAFAESYVAIITDLGPELTGTWIRLDLSGEIDVFSLVHSGDGMLIRLMRNCQQDGIILNPEPAETLAPIGVNAIYMLSCEWCREKGAFPLRPRARSLIEAVFHVAPEYRWTEAERAEAEKI